MSKITNNSTGPRAVNTSKGAVVLQPGETLGDKHEVSAEEVKAMEACGFLEAGAGSLTEPASHAQVQEMLGSMVTPPGAPVAGKPDGQTADELEKANSKDQLLEIAATEGVDVKESASKPEIAKAIADKRAAG